MKGPVRVALIVLVVGAGVLLFWSHLDRTASRVVLAVSGFGLLLAWYSILDLREARRERIWPHTVDRLMRATFTAVTLVCVVNIVVPRPAVEATPGPAATFSQALLESGQPADWNNTNLLTIIARHFEGMSGSGSLKLRLANGHEFVLAGGAPVGGQITR